MSGFGHRVYKNYDPRAKVIKKLAEEVFSIVGRDPLIEVFQSPYNDIFMFLYLDLWSIFSGGATPHVGRLYWVRLVWLGLVKEKIVIKYNLMQIFAL